MDRHSAPPAGAGQRVARRGSRRWAWLLAALALALAAPSTAAAQGGPGVAAPFGGAPPGPPVPGGVPVAAAAPTTGSTVTGIAAGAPTTGVAAAGTATGIPIGGGAATGTASGADEIGQMAEAVNAIRAENGRAPLRLQPQLAAAAQRHADEMAQSRTLSHVGPTGTRPSDRMGAAGYETCGGGENVAFGALQTVDDIARGWYDSPSHRELLLNDQVREMGIGRAQTADGLVYWALELGQRPRVAPIVVNQEAAATASSSVSVYVYPQISDSCLGPARRIVQVTLSNSPDFADAQTFAYSSVIPWTLAAGEGPRTVYARLVDESGGSTDAQDDILVSSTAPPPNTATNLSPPVQTVTVNGPNGPTQLTIYRTSYILPSDGALTVAPCGAAGPCYNVGGTSLPSLGPNPAPLFPGAPNPAGRQLGAFRRAPDGALGPLPAPGAYGPASLSPSGAPPGYASPGQAADGAARAAPLPTATPAASGPCPPTGPC